ncbi:MAG: HEPN domain-containing protein [Bacteroidota bacterium]
MEEHISTVIQDAEKMLEDAQFLLENDRYESAVNRAYYAAFHCAQSLLQNDDVLVKTHVGTRRKFSELFIKTGILPKTLGEYLAQLENYRMIADYSYGNEVSSNIAAKAVHNAAYFLAETKSYFKDVENKTDEPDKEQNQ